jgi:hypothetical protein
MGLRRPHMNREKMSWISFLLFLAVIDGLASGIEI